MEKWPTLCVVLFVSDQSLSLQILSSYIYSFCQIFQRPRLFKGPRLIETLKLRGNLRIFNNTHFGQKRQPFGSEPKIKQKNSDEIKIAEVRKDFNP